MKLLALTVDGRYGTGELPFPCYETFDCGGQIEKGFGDENVSVSRS